MLVTLTMLVTTKCSHFKPMLADTDNKPPDAKTNDVHTLTQVNATTPAITDLFMQQKLDKKNRLNQKQHNCFAKS